MPKELKYILWSNFLEFICVFGSFGLFTGLEIRLLQLDNVLHCTQALGGNLFNMNNQNPDDYEDTTVSGFEVPLSPVSSYNNVYSTTEDETRDPPVVPPHLQHSMLGYPDSTELDSVPQNVILNHLYIENRDAPRSVVALGFSHRFRSKYVTVVIYKPVQRRGNTNV